MTSPKHGGQRPGTGRRPVDTTEHRVRLPRDVVSLLAAVGAGRLSRGIVLAADLYPGGECHRMSRSHVDIVEHRVRLPRDRASFLTHLGAGRLSRGIVRAADALRIGYEKPPEA